MAVIPPERPGDKIKGGLFPVLPLARGRTILVLAIILLLATAVYSNSINNGFTNWDDHKNVYENYAIRDFSAANIKHWFTKPLSGMYTPLAYISFAIDYKLGGLDPRIYHLVNLILHLLNISLVYFIAGRFARGKEIAGVVALLFAIHPMNVGAVAWVSGRSTLLFSSFYLAAFYSYLLYLDHKFRNRYLVYALILFILSLLSKSAAVTLPVLLLLTDYYFGRKIDKRAAAEKVPFFVLSVIFGVLTFIFRQDAGTLASIYVYSFIERVFLVCYALAFYIVKLFLPINLSPYYPYPDKVAGLLPWEFYLSPLVLAGIAGLIIWARDFRRELMFGAGFFIVHIALLLRIIPMGGDFVCDRYMYLPGIGIFLIVGLAYSRARQGKGPFRSKVFVLLSAVMIIAALALSIVAYDKNRTWKDSLTLWDEVIKTGAKSPLTYNNRCVARIAVKDYIGAIDDCNRALLIDPLWVAAYVNRASAKSFLKDYSGAMADYEQALKIAPDSYEIFHSRCLVRREAGDLKGSIKDCEEAAKSDLYDGKALAVLCSLRLESGDTGGAVADCSRLAASRPGDVSAMANLGNAQALGGMCREAISTLSSAVALGDNDKNAFYNRAVCRMKLGDNQGACSDWKESAKLGDIESAGLLGKYCK